MSNLTFLAVGYGVVWVIIFTYVAFIGQRQAALRNQLEALQLEVNAAAERVAREQ
jgi:CcmD family protein